MLGFMRADLSIPATTIPAGMSRVANRPFPAPGIVEARTSVRDWSISRGSGARCWAVDTPMLLAVANPIGCAAPIPSLPYPAALSIMPAPAAAVAWSSTR